MLKRIVLLDIQRASLEDNKVGDGDFINGSCFPKAVFLEAAEKQVEFFSSIRFKLI